MRKISEANAAICRSLDARIEALYRRSREYREAMVKTFILNQYALLHTGAGLIISPKAIRHLTAKCFSEVAVDDPKAAREQVVRLRQRLLVEYPFWIPNRFHLAVELHCLFGKQREIAARSAFIAAMPLLEGMVIDSDHYCQLFIDCRFNPFGPNGSKWISGNPRPWHLPERFLRALAEAWRNEMPPFSIDGPAIIARLMLHE
jgi:hypothetical protein